MSIAVLDSGNDQIPFEVSQDKVRTWHDASREEAARWHSHEVYMGKPVKEFLGPGDSRIPLAMRFDIERGVVPRDEIRRLRKLMQEGIVLQFTVGDSLVGDFFIKDVKEEWTRFSPKGVLLVAEVTITLEEYR